MLLCKLKMNYAVRQWILIKSYWFINYFFYFKGKPENLAIDDNESIVENIIEEVEEEQYIKPLELDVIDEELLSVEDVNEEFMDENMEMGEEGEEEDLLTDLKTELEEEDESQIKKKKESEESFLSLPVTKLCTVVKLKNKFNFFDRISQTKKILMRVKSDNIKYFITVIFYLIIILNNFCNL